MTRPRPAAAEIEEVKEIPKMGEEGWGLKIVPTEEGESPERQKEPETQPQPVMIDTSGKGSKANDDEDEKQEDVKEEEESDDEEDDTPEAGGSGKILFFGIVVAAAAGAAYYCKKNEIPVQDIMREKLNLLRRNAESFIASFKKE